MTFLFDSLLHYKVSYDIKNYDSISANNRND